jgi:hypothetical protein
MQRAEELKKRVSLFGVRRPHRENQEGFLPGQSRKRSRVQLIPTCVLRDASKMGKVSHRTETLRISFQLIESITDLVNDLIESGQS